MSSELEQLKSKRKFTQRLWSGWFAVFSLFLVVFQSALFGYNMAKGNHQYAVSDAILAFLWLGLLIIQTRTWKLDVEMKFMDRDLERLEKTGEFLKKLTQEAELERGKQDANTLIDIIKELHPKSAPTEKDLPALAAAFYGKTGRYVKLRAEDGGLAAEFTDTPAVPGRSDAHEAARLRGDASRADVPAKPLTKSQQRRINAKKGLGPLTDDEVREAKNKKRREARAAKKAEGGEQTQLT